MKTLEDTNLISGVTDGKPNLSPDPGATTGHVPGTTTGHDPGPTTGHDEASSNNPGSTTTDESVVAVTEATKPDDESAVERIVDKTLSRLTDKLREAEERGFRRAVEMARNNPEALGIDRSVPNFLASVRKDIWDS